MWDLILVMEKVIGQGDSLNFWSHPAILLKKKKKKHLTLLEKGALLCFSLIAQYNYTVVLEVKKNIYRLCIKGY